MFEVSPDGTAFTLTGPEDEPVVVLIHGLGLCRHLWVDHLPAFESRYRVLNYDLYGHGDSASPREKASLTVYAKQLSDLMDHLEIGQASIVGFSIGGMINRRFAMDFPEKTAALAILNSPHDRGVEAQRQVEERALKAMDQGTMATIDAAMQRWFTPEYLESGAGVQSVRDWRAQVDPESFAQASWVLANGVRELIGLTPPLAVPTLVMTCENDPGSTPGMSVDINTEIPGSELIVVPELRHLGMMERPELFSGPVLEFLERVLR